MELQVNTVQAPVNPALKRRLNNAKTRMDSHRSRAFAQYMRVIDSYAPLRRILAERYGAQHVSNAWLKYYEIYSRFYDKKGRIRAFFNAELPGAALCAFNHFVSGNFDWHASSLLPTDGNTALSDVYGLYANHRDRWLMNADNDGDVTKLANLLDFERRLEKVDLYSHDAGVDVSADYNEQEVLNSKVHLGCAIAGFLTMAPGAMFVAKQYTFFESFTQNLIMLYAEMFDEFYLFKPRTSRPTNSEIYLIGKGFRGFTHRDYLLELLEATPGPIVESAGDLPAVTARPGNIGVFADRVFSKQAQLLDDAVDNYESDIVVTEQVNLEQWIQKMNVLKINPKNYL